jgi:hypothetical protein
VSHDHDAISFYRQNFTILQSFLPRLLPSTTQTVLTVVKDKFAKVITEETLSPTNKPTDWNVVITEKALLKAMRTPSPPSEEI